MTLKESLKEFGDSAKSVVEAEAALIKMQHGEGAECLYRAMISVVGDIVTLHVLLQDVPQRTAGMILDLNKGAITSLLDYIAKASKCDEELVAMLNDKAIAMLDRLNGIQDKAVSKIMDGLHNG